MFLKSVSEVPRCGNHRRMSLGAIAIMISACSLLVTGVTASIAIATFRRVKPRIKIQSSFRGEWEAHPEGGLPTLGSLYVHVSSRSVTPARLHLLYLIAQWHEPETVRSRKWHILPINVDIDGLEKTVASFDGVSGTVPMTLQDCIFHFDYVQRVRVVAVLTDGRSVIGPPMKSLQVLKSPALSRHLHSRIAEYMNRWQVRGQLSLEDLLREEGENT